MTINQRESLSQWINYLSSDNAMYPMWAKYWAFNSVLKLGKFNKEKGYFDKRGKGSVAPFPTVNAMALSKSIATIQDRINNQEIENFSNKNDIDFQKILNKEDFGRLYAMALESMPEFSEKGLENIKGEWVVYNQGDNAQELFDSIQGYPLEWCTAGSMSMAQSQLDGGNFHVYYSENDKGENKIPRIAIRMEGDNIAEVRGIEKGQNLDNFISPVVKEKMQEFGERGEAYEKRVEDMEQLKNIYNKTFKIINLENNEKEYLNPDFTEDDIKFIYEFDEKIENFGHNKDPRIKEIIEQRKGADIEKIKNMFLDLDKENGGEKFIQRMLRTSNEYVILDNIDEFTDINCGMYNEQILSSKSFLDIIKQENKYICREDLLEAYFINFEKTLFFDEISDDEYENYLGHDGANMLRNFLQSRNIIDDFSEMTGDFNEEELIEFIEKVKNYEINYEEGNPYKDHVFNLIELVIEKLDFNDEDDYMDIENDLNNGIPFSKTNKSILSNKKESTRERVYVQLHKENICREEIHQYIDEIFEDALLPENMVNMVLREDSLLDENLFKKVIDNYSEFSPNLLNRDFVDKALTYYSADILLDNIDKFIETDREYIINKSLIRKSAGSVENDFYENIKKFKEKNKLDYRGILKSLLVHYSHDMSLIDNLDLFDLYPIEILETDWCRDSNNCVNKIFENWEKFEGIENEVADFIIEKGGKSSVMRNIDKFSNKLNLSIVKKFFDEDDNGNSDIQFVARNLDNFNNLNLQDILDLIYKSGGFEKVISEISSNIAKLNMNQREEFFKKSINAGYLNFVMNNVSIDNFELKFLFDALMSVDDYDKGLSNILSKIDEFSAIITQKELEKIIDKSDGRDWRMDSVIDNFDKLKNIYDHKVIARKLFIKGQYYIKEKMQRNIGLFKVVTIEDLDEWEGEKNRLDKD